MDSVICLLMVVTSKQSVRRGTHTNGRGTGLPPPPALPSAIQLRTNRAKRALGGVLVARVCRASSRRIECDSTLSPEKIVEGVAGSATSTVYGIYYYGYTITSGSAVFKMGGYWLGVNHRRGCENLRTKDQELWSMAVLTKHGSFTGAR
jgi:hypothetical protein